MSAFIISKTFQKLYKSIFDVYHLEENKNKLLFHGWHHIQFVQDKSVEFAQELKADIEITASAALVHDLNYIFTEKLEPEAAKEQTAQYLRNAGFDEAKVQNILETVENAHSEYRGARELTNEAKALSDADTLFKALPTTPILFASKFITQNKYDIKKLAHKVINEQEPLMLNGTYFYTDLAKNNYSKWAKVNLEMWKNVLESLGDEAVKKMLETAEELGVL